MLASMLSQWAITVRAEVSVEPGLVRIRSEIRRRDSVRGVDDESSLACGHGLAFVIRNEHAQISADRQRCGQMQSIK